MNKKENWPFLLELKKKQKQKQKITVKYGSNEHAYIHNRIHSNSCHGRLGWESNELGRGSNDLGRGINIYEKLPSGHFHLQTVQQCKKN